MFVRANAARPAVYSDVGQDPYSTLTQNMLQAMSGSGNMGPAPVTTTAGVGSSDSGGIPWFLILGGLAAAWFVLRR